MTVTTCVILSCAQNSLQKHMLIIYIINYNIGFKMYFYMLKNS